MKKCVIYLLAPLLIPILAFGFHSPQSSQVRLSVPDSEPRPLAKMAELLERKFGIPISYEDAPWIFGGDLLPLPAGTEKTSTDSGIPAIGAGRLDVTLPIDVKSGGMAASLDGTLKKVLEQHVANKNPGTFQLVSLGEAGFSIVANEVRDSNGRKLGVSSPLDTKISFAEQKRRGIDILVIICEEISKASGKETKIGTIPKSFINSSVELGGRNEAGRDLLLKTLQKVQRADPRNPAPISKFAWRLLYSPTGQTYYLNIHPVQ